MSSAKWRPFCLGLNVLKTQGGSLQWRLHWKVKFHPGTNRLDYFKICNFHEDIYLNYLNNAPFMICNIYDDPYDKTWCYTKLLSDVMEKNAPSKSKIAKKPSVPFMNSNLRKAMHKRNMLRNKYKKGLVGWDAYRRQRNLTPAIYKRSKQTYFPERCEGCVKNQKFWKTIKPFMLSKQPRNAEIILCKSDKIVTDERIICNLSNDYISNVAKEIGFDDEIPDDFQTADGSANIIDKHSSHPSIIKIDELSSTERSFVFYDVNESEVEKMIKTMDPKKAQGFDIIPNKLLRLGALGIAHHISSLINHFL